MKTIQQIVTESKHQIPHCNIQQALKIDHLLNAGISFHRLKGKKIRCNNSLIRFKIGRSFRLIYQVNNDHLEAISIVSRQNFDKQIKRR
jgi:mRNA-degrading endonuclease RelE of RelBE toxin-antitoxin system|tara:strand:+ start:33 stop:299 length:267 start_codon:yes stop_codon:yes gene_type:complete